MSGGIDSSVAANILQQQDYEVIGVTLLFYHKGNTLPNYLTEAQQLAKQLNIKHHVIDVRTDFSDTVIRYFKEEYLAGRTPSPCIMCNEKVKWKHLLEQADKFNCQYVATGHYINIDKEDDTYYIYKGIDTIKDQSYFLWNLNQTILSRTLTPLGSYTKQEIKELANQFGCKTAANQKESMGVCFLGKTDYRDFIKQQIPDIDQQIGKGNIVNTCGEVVGSHDGYAYYTVGQKRGLNLLQKNGLMVSEIDVKTNTLKVDTKQNLHKNRLKVSNYQFNNTNDISSNKITTIVRGLGLNPKGYSKIKLLNNKELIVTLENPAWAIAPGQPVAFYIDNKLIGGGFAEIF